MNPALSGLRVSARTANSSSSYSFVTIDPTFDASVSQYTVSVDGTMTKFDVICNKSSNSLLWGDIGTDDPVPVGVIVKYYKAGEHDKTFVDRAEATGSRSPTAPMFTASFNLGRVSPQPDGWSLSQSDLIEVTININNTYQAKYYKVTINRSVI